MRSSILKPRRPRLARLAVTVALALLSYYSIRQVWGSAPSGEAIARVAALLYGGVVWLPVIWKYRRTIFRAAKQRLADGSIRPSSPEADVLQELGLALLALAVVLPFAGSSSPTVGSG